MVAHTEIDNNTTTPTISASLPINNFFIPSIKMNLPQNLRKKFD
jgi:hypothetical protein